jgi:hypothetical protein
MAIDSLENFIGGTAGFWFSIAGILFGAIVYYLSRRIERFEKAVEEVKGISARMDGIQSFAATLVEMQARLTVCEKMLDRRKTSDKVEP